MAKLMSEPPKAMSICHPRLVGVAWVFTVLLDDGLWYKDVQ